MLEYPKEKLDEPPPRPETPRDVQNTTARTARDLRDKLVRDRVTLENEERRARGLRVGPNIYHHEVRNKLVFILFHSLGSERGSKYHFIYKAKWKRKLGNY